MNANTRYENFLSEIRKLEFEWNLDPDHLIMCAAFLLARAKMKKIVRCGDIKLYEECHEMLMKAYDQEKVPDVA